MPRLLYPRERPGTHRIGGWVVPKAGLDGCGKSRPPPGFCLRTVPPIASRYTDWDIPAHLYDCYTQHMKLRCVTAFVWFTVTVLSAVKLSFVLNLDFWYCTVSACLGWHQRDWDLTRRNHGRWNRWCLFGGLLVWPTCHYKGVVPWLQVRHTKLVMTIICHGTHFTSVPHVM
jgi:hypothetical protein